MVFLAPLNFTATSDGYNLGPSSIVVRGHHPIVPKQGPAVTLARSVEPVEL